MSGVVWSGLVMLFILDNVPRTRVSVNSNFIHFQERESEQQ